MTRKILFAFAVISLALLTTRAYAGGSSIGARISTLGAGVEVDTPITESISARAGVNYYPTISDSGTESNISYDIDLDLLSVPLLLDWRPFKGSFRLSGGAIYNANEIELRAKPTASYSVGGNTYQADQIGTLRATVDYDDIAPYLSFGWDTSFGKSNGFGFVLELGAFYQGSPNVEITATGALASNQQLQSDLAREKAELERAIDSKIYPVVAIGFSYRF